MKKVFAGVLLSLIATVTVVAQTTSTSSNVVVWRSMIGNITAPGVSNPVGGIASATQPWTATGGFAAVDLSTGAIAFAVEGLVLNGSNSSGTTGPVTNVTGALVCSASSSPTVIETSSVTLSAQGNAAFSGTLSGIPSSCTSPVFLIRIPGAAWIATGAVRIP